MRAAVFYKAFDIRTETVPDPKPQNDEVVVQVKACGFCGSDVEYYYGRSPVGTATGEGPLVLGHEFSGEVVEVGSVARGLFKPGDRVAVNPIQSCGACDECRAGRPQFCQNLSVLGVTKDGGFAEFAASKMQHLYKLPDEISYETGAFVEPLAASVNAVDKLDVPPGSYVVIFGPGPMGLSMVQLVRNLGAAQVAMVGTNDERLETARELGATALINTRDTGSPYYAPDIVEAVKNHGGGQLAERAIVPTSSLQAAEDALRVTGNGAVVVLLGVTGPNDNLPVPLLTSLIQDKTIRFSLWYPNKWPKTIRLLAQHGVSAERLLTHMDSLENIGSAIERLVARKDGVLKTVITPG